MVSHTQDIQHFVTFLNDTTICVEEEEDKVAEEEELEGGVFGLRNNNGWNSTTIAVNRYVM